MESKPIKAKKTAATPFRIPPTPFGAKGDQFSGFTKKAPATITKAIIPSFRITRPLLTFLDSLIPTNTNAVINTVIKPAGKSKRICKFPITGAVSYVLAAAIILLGRCSPTLACKTCS